MSVKKFRDSPFGNCSSHSRVDLLPLRTLPPLLAAMVSDEGQENE